MAGKRRKGRAVRFQKADHPAVSSLGGLQKLLDAHAAKERFHVLVDSLLGIGDATPMRDLLRHQEATKQWVVSGLEQLEVLAKVDGMIGHAAGLLDRAIAHMEAVAEAADPAVPTADGYADTDAEPLAPVPALLSPRRLAKEDTPTLDLAGRMVEAGMGLCVGPLVPCAALLGLAARALDDEGPSGVIDLAADTVEANPAALSPDATAKLAPAMRSLGAEDTVEVATKDEKTGEPDHAALSLNGADEAELAPAMGSLGEDDSVEVDTDDEKIGELAHAACRPTGPVVCFSVEDPAACIPNYDKATLDLAERMMEAGTGRRGVPGPALRELAADVLAADAFNTFNTADGMVPARGSAILGAVDHESSKLAERMLEAGTGRRGPPRVPTPAILQLAARVVAGDSPPRDHGAAARDIFTRLLDSGTALRYQHLGSTSVERSVQSLGFQIEDLSSAVLSCRHPPAMLLQFLYTVRRSLIKLRDASAVTQEQFAVI